MKRRFSALAGLCLVASFVSVRPLAAAEENPHAPTIVKRVAPVTALPPKPLDLRTYENRAFDAYSQALADGKYTLLLFSKAHEINGFAHKMERNLTDPKLAIYSAHFVAALVDEDHDQGGEHLARALNIQRYPTVIVLKTDLDRLHVVGRIEGVFGTDDIDKVLREALKEQEPQEPVHERDKT